MKEITKEQLAERLNDNKRWEEIAKEQEQIAKENNLLVLFSATVNSLEAKGAINDEYNAYLSERFLLIKSGETYVDDENEDVFHKAEENGLYGMSDYCDDDNPRLIRIDWSQDNNSSKTDCIITTNMPSVPFTTKEDEEPYCEGIVIDLDEIQ